MPAKISDLDSVFSSLLSVLVALVGLAVFFMFIIGGYQFLMAGGDKDAVARARHTLTYAILGLVLAVSAVIIINLIGGFFGVSLTVFSVCLGGPGTC